MKHIRENLERHLTELCLRIGSRHTGSPGEKAAADYIEKVFREYGYEPRREAYHTVGWEYEGFEFINLTEKRSVPCALPCFFSNSAVVEGKLLWLRPGDMTHLEDFPVKGRLCMVEFWNDFNNVMGRNKIAEILDGLGAAAAIFISNVHTSYAPSSKIQRSPFLKRIGTCAVSQEGAYDLARHKEDSYRLVIKARCIENTSCNVIARRSGTGDFGVFGAHYDTAPLTQGAGDNGTGTAMLLEVARLLKDEPTDMRLDFAAFSAEEYIPDILPPGSGDYVRRHSGENIRWYMNFDDFGILIGEPILKFTLPEKLPRQIASRKYPMVKTDVYGGDDKSFSLAGIPSFWYNDRGPFYQMHTPLDSLDIVDFDKIKPADESRTENIFENNTCAVIKLFKRAFLVDSLD